MALSRDDLISGLREGLRGRSYIDKNEYTLVQLAEFIDMNVNNFARVVSKVGGNEMLVGELVAWCDYYLSKTIPDLIRVEARKASCPYKLIRHKDTGAVYAWKPGDRPIFYWVQNNDELWFLESCGLAGGWSHVVDAETNLTEFTRNELLRFAVDTSKVEALQKKLGPPTYNVVPGDTFIKIAANLKVTVDQLKAANPDVTDVDKIEVGQVLNIPKP